MNGTAVDTPSGRVRSCRFRSGLLVSLIWYGIVVAGLALFAALQSGTPESPACDDVFDCGSPRDQVVAFSVVVVVPALALAFGLTLLLLGLLVRRLRSAVW